MIEEEVGRVASPLPVEVVGNSSDDNLLYFKNNKPVGRPRRKERFDGSGVMTCPICRRKCAAGNRGYDVHVYFCQPVKPRRKNPVVIVDAR